MEKLTGSVHPGEWQLHHISLPEGPTDFTPVRRDAHQEQKHSVLDGVVDALPGLVIPASTRETKADQAEPGA
jgi:hypothetical protein